MKPYQRRQTATYPYYKIATWDNVSMTYRDGKQAFLTKFDAINSVAGRGPNKYRISVVTADGRRDLDPFEVGKMVGGD